MDEPRRPPAGALREVAGLFLRLGCTAFGGPAAHAAMMEDEVVRRRRWLSRDEFLDLLGAANLIPGPNSTELAIHVGHRRAGWPGLLVAGVCFAMPAVAIVTVLAWAYVRFGTVPQARAWMDGVRPVVLAVVAQALFRLGRSALKTRLLAGLAGAAANLAGADELLVLFAGGARAMAARRRPIAPRPTRSCPSPWPARGRRWRPPPRRPPPSACGPSSPSS
jgi:chromate transporter